MHTKFKQNYEYKRTVSVLALLTLLFGVFLAVFEIFAFPLLVAWLASLTVFTLGNKKWVALPIACAAVSVALGFLTSWFAVFLAVSAVTVSAAIALTFFYSRSKPESVSISVGVFLVVTMAALWICAAVSTKSASFDAVKGFYVDFYNRLRAELLVSFDKSIASMGESASAEEMTAVKNLIPVYLDNLAYLSPSIFAVLAFVLVGFSYKLFVRVIYRYSAFGEVVFRWRFTTTNVFVVFYLMRAVLNIFLTDTGAFSVTVKNFYTFFNFLYAYIGYNFITAIMAQRMKYSVAVLIVLAALLLFSSLAVNLLAISGVVFTFIGNKAGGFGAMPKFQGSDKKPENESENDNEKD